MKYYEPADYRRFACLKGACKNTCCAGWEIDIDPDTAELYRSLPGSLGERARGGMKRDGDVFSFRLNSQGRCPMLDPDGLCALIRELGEQALCDICTDHPRYRNWFSDRMEIGLGLCCEAAARQAVFRRRPVRLLLTDDDGAEESLREADKSLLSLREDCLSVFWRNDLSWAQKERRFLSRLKVRPPFVCCGEEAFLRGLERLDPKWDERLSLLRRPLPPRPVSSRRCLALSQLAVYFLYRHLPDAVFDGLTVPRALFALWAVRLIGRMTVSPSLPALADTARMFSAEIEYSDENLAACFAYLQGQAVRSEPA